MKNENLIKVVFTLALLAIGGTVIAYYWSVEGEASLKQVPIWVMVLCFVYVLIQVVKRYILKRQNWWDWLYYIGLISVMIPAYFSNEKNWETFELFADFGSLFLIVPLLFDIKSIVDKK